MWENVAIFFRPWPNCNVSKKRVEKKSKLIICYEISLFVRLENVAILFRPWPIVMFQKRGSKKNTKLIKCNGIPLFVKRENGAILFFSISACLFGNVLVLVSFGVFFLLAIRPLLLISRDLSRNRNRIYSHGTFQPLALVVDISLSSPINTMKNVQRKNNSEMLSLIENNTTSANNTRNTSIGDTLPLEGKQKAIIVWLIH